MRMGVLECWGAEWVSRGEWGRSKDIEHKIEVVMDILK